MLYKQIAEQLKKYILNENLKPGDKLPSIRNLTNHFECSKNTIISALKNLEETGLIYAIQKQGYFVTQGPDIENEKTITFDFLSAEPNIETLNTKNLLSCSEKISHDLKNVLLPYGSQNGLDKLRKQLVPYFQNNQVFTNKENIVIMDARRPGGGLKESIKDRDIEERLGYTSAFWDIGSFDGLAYYENGVSIIRLPERILQSNGGLFTETDIREKLGKYLAFGVYPIIEFIPEEAD